MTKARKAAIGLASLVTVLSMAVAPIAGAATSSIFSRKAGLGDLFTLDMLFRSTDSTILNPNKADLGSLMILNQLFPVQATVAQVSLAQSLSGRILIQVEKNGEAWYVRPSDAKRVSLGDPASAFNYMASVAVGITNADYNSFNGVVSGSAAGKFWIKTQDSGKIYYADPVSKTFKFVDGAAGAASLIKSVGLGITDANLAKIAIAQ